MSATKRISDPELKAMAGLAEILATLDDETRRRVVQWLVERYLDQESRQNGSGHAISPPKAS